MASTYTGLGTEKMTTGENAGTWGTTTNTNLQILEQIAGGYIEKAVTSTPTTLSVSDGSTGAELSHRIIKFTGTISADTVVTVPLDVQQMYILLNGTSGNYLVTFKYVSGSGSTVVFKGTDKGTKLVYATADDGTNPNMVDTGIGSHQIHNTLTVGIDDTGYDVKFFGATSGSYALWDESADSLLLTDSTPLKIGDSQDLTLYHDGSNSYITNAVGALKVATETSGIAVTIGHTTSETTVADNLTTTGNTSVGGTLGVTGVATFATHVALGDSDILKLGAGTDLTLYHDGTNSYITNAVGALKIATETSGIALTIGHTTSETTIADNLTVTGDAQGTTITATTAFVPDASDGAALGTSALEFSDLFLADSAVLNFGDDQDTTLTHTDGTGLTLNSTNKLCFYDTALSISSSTDGQLDIDADTEVEIATTTLDLNGALDVSGASQFSGAITVGVDDTGLDVKLFGASAGAYMEWDESADQLRIVGASADATTSTGKLLLATSLTDINASDVIGKIDFQAPLEAGGTDAITVAASIQAMAQGTFSASVNATDLLFFTGHSEAATEKFRFTSEGEIGVGGANYGTDGQVLTSGGAGAAPAWETVAGGLTGKVEGTNFTGSLLVGHSTTGTLNAASNNTGVGIDALDALTSGDDNIGIGYQAGSAIAGGSSNVVMGKQAGDAITSGGSNVAIGALALSAAATNSNVGVGAYALHSVTGSSNVGVGQNAGVYIAGGDFNICLGQLSGDNITSGSGNVVIGKADVSSATADDQLSISDGEDGAVVWITGDSSANITLAADLTIGDDFNMTTDSSVINFGADSDTTLTHTDGTGLTLNSTNKLCFNDATQFVYGISGTVLGLGATDEIDLTATAIDINGTCDVSGTLTNASTAVNVAGTQTMWVPANAMTPTASNGCADIAAVETTSGRPDMYVLDFDKDSDEHAQFAVAFPKSWDLGVITFQVFWSGIAATSDVDWGLQGVGMPDNETIDVAYGSAVVVTDNAQGAVEELLVSAESGDVTIAGTPADDDLTYFRIFRDVSGDAMSGDARLHGVKLFYTTDAKNDA
jgi:hypothetical protein